MYQRMVVKTRPFHQGDEKQSGKGRNYKNEPTPVTCVQGGRDEIGHLTWKSPQMLTAAYTPM